MAVSKKSSICEAVSFRTPRQYKRTSGHFISCKTNTSVWYKSALQRDFMYWLEFDPDVVSYTTFDCCWIKLFACLKSICLKECYLRLSRAIAPSIADYTNYHKRLRKPLFQAMLYSDLRERRSMMAKVFLLLTRDRLYFNSDNLLEIYLDNKCLLYLQTAIDEVVYF